jgi:peroxiredoxin
MLASLACGRAPDCHCFGQLHSEPVGPSSIARNVALGALAAFVVVGGRNGAGTSATDWFGALTGAERAGVVMGAIALALLALQTWFLANLVRQNRALIARLQTVGSGAEMETAEETARQLGLLVGSTAPTFRLPDIDGREMALGDLRAQGKPVMLVFTDPDCGPCNALMSEVGTWQRKYESELTIAVVSRGGLESNRGKRHQFELELVLLQSDHEMERAYEVSGTPAAVIVQPAGIVGSPVAAGADQIRGLLQQIRTIAAAPSIQLLNKMPEREDPQPILKVGEPPPHVTFTDVRGTTVSLRDFRGRDVVVLFWNSTCGFCQQLLPDLKAWEGEPRPEAPELVVIVPGTVDGMQAVKFRSPVLIDRDGAGAAAFGAEGTPMAVLIDSRGKVASSLAAGAEEVLDLIDLHSAARAANR